MQSPLIKKHLSRRLSLRLQRTISADRDGVRLSELDQANLIVGRIERKLKETIPYPLAAWLI
jgi:inactivated superfamily I helicase